MERTPRAFVLAKVEGFMEAAVRFKLWTSKYVSVDHVDMDRSAVRYPKEIQLGTLCLMQVDMGAETEHDLRPEIPVPANMREDLDERIS